MFSNTLTLTINTVAKVLNRVNQDSYGSEYVFRDANEEIRMQIRHSTDKLAAGDTFRHNVYIERTVFATPTVAEKYWSTTFTFRDRRGSGPTDLLYLVQAGYTLLATLDDGLVVGEN